MITHPEKVLFPADGITKGELAAYYERVAHVMLPHLRGRPVTMERFPAGIGEKGDVWADMHGLAQSLHAPLATLRSTLSEADWKEAQAAASRKPGPRTRRS